MPRLTANGVIEAKELAVLTEPSQDGWYMSIKVKGMSALVVTIARRGCEIPVVTVLILITIIEVLLLIPCTERSRDSYINPLSESRLFHDPISVR